MRLAGRGEFTWNWQDRALLRVYRWLHNVANFPAEGDDTWQPFVVNYYYETNFPTETVSQHGKNVSPACWTHQVIP
jgi:hypothetical protein